MSEFKVGDVVRVKGIIGPNMVVIPNPGYTIGPVAGEERKTPLTRVWYFRDGKVQDLSIFPDILELVTPGFFPKRD